MWWEAHLLNHYEAEVVTLLGLWVTKQAWKHLRCQLQRTKYKLGLISKKFTGKWHKKFTTSQETGATFSPFLNPYFVALFPHKLPWSIWKSVKVKHAALYYIKLRICLRPLKWLQLQTRCLLQYGTPKNTARPAMWGDTKKSTSHQHVHVEKTCIDSAMQPRRNKLIHLTRDKQF